MGDERTIAYFSMEIGIDPNMPTYSGGLGVLAGDTIRSAADLGIPMVGLTLLHRKGYFYQRLDSEGRQIEEPVEWEIGDFLEEMPKRVSVQVEGRTVYLRAWRYPVAGLKGFKVPVYFLDTDLPENSEWDRALTDFLYGGDERYRLCQEVVLGIGGVRMLRGLGFRNIERFHMNEGHASLLALELLDEEAAARVAGVEGGIAMLDSAFFEAAEQRPIRREDIKTVRQKCVFTTHTPVPAGHDQFPLELVVRVLGRREIEEMKDVFCSQSLLNMTYLALNLSRYVNGVAKQHGDIAQLMFGRYTIDSITNGVHAATWTSEPFRALFDRYVPGWREDNFSLRYALNIPNSEVWQAHTEAKRELIHYVNRETNIGMDQDVFTVGFARRATAYKRADMLLHDPERLEQIASKTGPFQVIYSGKAHPRDAGGKELIVCIHQAMERLKKQVRIAYLPNYDIELARVMTAGSDLWLNTPQPAMEASGTSGMKAALNGVPSLSTLDGWWVEGHIEGVTGWSIGGGEGAKGGAGDRAKEAESLYDKLEQIIIPLFYHQRDQFIRVMACCIALNGSFFNTQRMVQQYLVKAYL